MKFGNHVDLGNFFYLAKDESVFLKKGENKSFVCVYVYLT